MSPPQVELDRFVRTTSMKGVGRAWVSPYIILRVLWTVSVLGFLGLATYQAYDLLSDFLEYQTVTIIKQNYTDSFHDVDPVTESPDLTLCNLNPYASNRSHLGIISIKDYSDLVKDYSADYPDQALIAQLQTTSGYYQYIGRDNAMKLGQTWTEFIAACYMEVFDGFASSWISCRDANQTSVISVTNPRLFNCFTIRVKSNDPSFIAGYSFILHLDNFEGEQYTYFTSSYQYSQYLGALVVPHMTGTKAWIERNAINLAPGVHTDLKLGLQIIQRMPPPKYGTCNQTEYLQRNPEWSYSVKGCISACLERQIAEVCQCNDASMMTVMEALPPNSDLPYCLQLMPDLNTTAAYDLCAKNQRLWLYQNCSSNCSVLCREYDYTTEYSLSYWPVDATASRFYDEYIAGRAYEWRYKDLYENDRSQYEIVVRKNFVSLYVYMADFSLLYYEDTPKTTFFSFLSSFGAALNLWAGITVMIFVEILEVLLRICLPPIDPASREARKTTNTPQPSRPLDNGLKRTDSKLVTTRF